MHADDVQCQAPGDAEEGGAVLAARFIVSLVALIAVWCPPAAESQPPLKR